MPRTHRFNQADAVRSVAGALIPGRAARVPEGLAYDERFVYSTERLASDGGVLLLDGWDLADYRSDPLFIAGHDIFGWDYQLQEAVLGRANLVQVEDDVPNDLSPDGRALVGYVQFAPTTMGQEFRALYGGGFLRACSVRWDYRTFKYREPTEAEIIAYASESATTGRALEWVGTYQRLMECSAVMFGADPGAKSFRGMIRAAVEDARGKGVPTPLVDRLLHRVERSDAPAPVPVGVDLAAIFRAEELDDAVKTGGLMEEGEDARPMVRYGSTTVRAASGAGLVVECAGTECGEALVHLLEGTNLQVRAEDGSALDVAVSPERSPAGEGGDTGVDQGSPAGAAGGHDTERAMVEVSAMNDGLAAVAEAADAMEAWLGQGAAVLQALRDGLSGMEALGASDSADAEVVETPEADERTADPRADVTARLEAAVDAMEELVERMRGDAAAPAAGEEAPGGAPEVTAADEPREGGVEAGADGEPGETVEAVVNGAEEVDLPAIFGAAD